jgi:hypothetical protein
MCIQWLGIVARRKDALRGYLPQRRKRCGRGMVVHAGIGAHARGVKPLLFGAMKGSCDIAWLDAHGARRQSAHRSNGI